MNSIDYTMVESFGSMVRFYDNGKPSTSSGKFKNITYYFDENNKRWKARPYNQWTSMTNRCLEEGQHKKNYKKTLLSHCSESFKDFDKWMDWASNQVGFMCTDVFGNLYQQDKDLVGGSDYYSEETCVFVPPYINNYMSIENMSSSRNFINRFLDEDFSKIDERVIGRILEDFSHSVSLSKFVYDSMILSKVDSQIKSNACQILKICKNTDEMTGISFKDGVYGYNFQLGGVVYKGSKFLDVVECSVEKLNLQIGAIKEYIVDQRHVFTTEYCGEAVEILEKLLRKILDGEIKFKKYVLVDY